MSLCAPIRATPGGLTVISPEPSPVETRKDRRVAALVRIAAQARKRRRGAEEALAEQRLLAREADHRVANWLQLVHSTLLLHAAAAPDGAPREAIRAAASSVAVAAEAHRHLYSSAALRPRAERTPDAVAYLDALVRKLSPATLWNGLAAEREVALRAEPGTAGAVAAGLLPRLGLVVAELVANALKHGTGPVLVELRPGDKAEGGGVVVAVSDNGPGIPPGFDPATCNGRSLGMRLLVALARPGRVWVDPADRRRILVRLPDRTAPGSS